MPASKMSQHKVARESEIKEGSIKIVEIEGGKRVALTKAGNQIFAFEDRCSHDDGELASGSLVEGSQVECPRHGARFDYKTGKATRMPAIAPIEVYPVEVKGGEIWLNIADET